MLISRLRLLLSLIAKFLVIVIFTHTGSTATVATMRYAGKATPDTILTGTHNFRSCIADTFRHRLTTIGTRSGFKGLRHNERRNKFIGTIKP